MRDRLKDGKLTPRGTPAQPRPPLRDEVSGYHTTEDDALIGHVVGDRYLIERALGEGSMGKVYAAKDFKGKEEEVAIKVISTNALAFSNKDTVIKRFIREAETAASVKHPNVIDVKDIGRFGDQVYYVMELVGGRPLDDVVGSEQNAFDINRFMRITEQICQGVQAAHDKKVVHRDLKPQNIMISIRNGREHVTVMDFGIAKFKENETLLTKPGSVLGTPRYMSPEQCRGSECDHRADIYSLGVIMYELLTGTTPFHGNLEQVSIGHLTQIPEPPSTKRAGIPQHIEGAVLKALAKKPEDRHQSVNAFMEALRGSATQKRDSGPAAISGAPEPEDATPAPRRTYQTFPEDIDEGRGGTIAKVVVTFIVAGALGIGGYIYRNEIKEMASGAITAARGQVAPEEEQPQPLPPITD
ncbi:MAG: serine/threonine-protein kinase, partial [Candidatus ainarchaeum sp.]|nr:serine/threonine-protein kinase [Candidatus ainarchaeum sp.]